ncbi:MAG TPA: hypothetical protein VGD69_21315 [Herpetosiphonaceae bacterium]
MSADDQQQGPWQPLAPDRGQPRSRVTQSLGAPGGQMGESGVAGSAEATCNHLAAAHRVPQR